MTTRIKTHIRTLVQKLLLETGDKNPLQDDESLLTTHRLSSLQIVTLAVELEKNYGIDFSNEFNQADFETINSIVALCIKHTLKEDH